MLFRSFANPSATSRRALALIFGGLTAFILATATASPVAATPNKPTPAPLHIVCDRLIDDFRTEKPGQLPRSWDARSSSDQDRIRKRPHFRVRRNRQAHVLHARFQDQTVTIGRQVKAWSLNEYPILQWKWRAIQLPAHAKETDSSRNDTAAAVYAVWEIGLPFKVRSIKYTWSSTLPTGTRYEKGFGHFQLLVKESGKIHLGKWRTERVNIRDHYARFFDRRDNQSPSGIAIMTDADSTDGRAEAEFTDFRLCRLIPVAVKVAR
ncbi:MAG: DUF3047 domain-containing protein [Polyangiaceae bacterium]|nr:DUF3047 domain-containing protein [Polyangiaceae bacterium]